MTLAQVLTHYRALDDEGRHRATRNREVARSRAAARKADLDDWIARHMRRI